MKRRNFWAKVDVRGPEECWPWKRATTKGYGVIRFKGRNQYAHRVAWEFTRELENGSIPSNMFVCHKCDNPPCCNPAHLFLGTHAENLKDAAEKKRFTNRPNRKLTYTQREKIRKRYRTGKWTQERLAEEYQVSRTLIERVVNEC